MKKFLSMVLVVVFIMAAFSGCSTADKLEVTLTDGTVKNMSAEELYSWKQEYTGRNFSEFESMVNGATISGTGTVTAVNIHKPDAFNYYSKEATRFQTHVILDNGVSLYFTLNCQNGYDGYVDGSYTRTAYPEMDIYENDRISFSGKMSMCEYNIDEDGITVDLSDIDIGETESVVSIDKIQGVELVS